MTLDQCIWMIAAGAVGLLVNDIRRTNRDIAKSIEDLARAITRHEVRLEHLERRRKRR